MQKIFPTDFVHRVTSLTFSVCYRTPTIYQAIGQALIKTEQPPALAIKARSGAGRTKAVELIKRQPSALKWISVIAQDWNIHPLPPTEWAQPLIQLWRKCGIKIVLHICSVNGLRDEVKYILDMYRSRVFWMVACEILNTTCIIVNILWTFNSTWN